MMRDILRERERMVEMFKLSRSYKRVDKEVRIGENRRCEILTGCSRG